MEAVIDLLDLRFLIVSQVKLAAKRAEWSKAFTRSARSVRPTMETATRSRRRTRRSLRKYGSRCHQQNAGCNDREADLLPVYVHVHSPSRTKIAIDYEARPQSV